MMKLIKRKTAWTELDYIKQRTFWNRQSAHRHYQDNCEMIDLSSSGYPKQWDGKYFSHQLFLDGVMQKEGRDYQLLKTKIKWLNETILDKWVFIKWTTIDKMYAGPFHSKEPLFKIKSTPEWKEEI